jgi:hypothetical protein
VVAVEEEQGGADSSQRPRYESYQQPQQQQQQAQPFQKKNVWVNKNIGGGASQKKAMAKVYNGFGHGQTLCVSHISAG